MRPAGGDPAARRTASVAHRRPVEQLADLAQPVEVVHVAGQRRHHRCGHLGVRRGEALAQPRLPDDHALTQSMLVKYRERGIEVLGIGIGEESRDLKLYIPRCAIVDDVRGLPPAIEDLFKAHVLKKAA